jgi:hypothetical protein
MEMGLGDTHRAVCYGDEKARRERSELKRDWETTTIDLLHLTALVGHRTSPG